MPRNYTHLTEEERDRLSLLKAQGESLRSIAAQIGRDVSTISRELKRNVFSQVDGYMPHKAQTFADQRISKGHERKRLRIPGLRSYVVQSLIRGWSPERIAGRWKKIGGKAISHEAIYQWIYADARNLIPLLTRAHCRRRKRYRGQYKTPHIPSRIPVSHRPAEIELRQQVGHWEGDTMVSQQSRGALLVLVERKTRYARLQKLPAKDGASMRKSVTRVLGAFSPPWRRSITYDNGSENCQHLEINKSLGTVSYFCQPMHSWEKGSVENIAGLVRRHLPKKTDFAKVSDAQVKKTERWINSLPRKCLGYETAAEALRRSVALTG